MGNCITKTQEVAASDRPSGPPLISDGGGDTADDVPDSPTPDHHIADDSEITPATSGSSPPPNLKQSDTLSTQPSNEESSYLAYHESFEEGGVILTPKNLLKDGGASFQSELFKTPQGQQCTTESRIPPAIAEERIIKDNVLDALAEEDVPSDFKTKQSLMYIYLNEFFWEKTQEDRIGSVKQCVVDKLCFDRLYRISRSDTSGRVVKTDDAFQDFCRFAATVELFFRQKSVKLVGTGFPKEPFLQIQTSAVCYVAAACVWYTLLRQQRAPLDSSNDKPVDIGKLTRKYVLGDDQALLDRVVHNKGGDAITLLMKVTGCNNLERDWERIHFVPGGKLSALMTGRNVLTYLQENEVGILTGFPVNEGFRVAKKEKKLGYGYWKYAALDIDCEGEWVELNPGSKDTEYINEKIKVWRETWNRNQAAIRQKKGVGENLFGKAFSEYDDEELPEKEDDEESPKKGKKDDVPTHAMVVLGGYEKEGIVYLFLLNWWVKMPLILVSADYLKACGCTVSFLIAELPDDDDVERTEGQIQYVECHHDDAGEDGMGPFSESIDG